MKNFFFLKGTFVGEKITHFLVLYSSILCVFQRSFIMEGGPVVIYQGKKGVYKNLIII